MVKVNYNITTGAIIGFYPDDITYTSIPAPYIEVDDQTYQDCINNQRLRKIDLENLVIINCEAAEATTDQKLTALDAEYQTQFDALIQALGVATLASDTELIADLQSEYTTLKAEYTTAREAIADDE